MKSLVFFNNKGGVGKTVLTFNLAHMLARQGPRVVVLDYDPQCNISAILLDEISLAEIWEADKPGETVKDCLDLVRRGKGEIVPPVLAQVADGLWLLPGHLGLSRFEQTLADGFAKTLGVDNERALDLTTALDLLSNLAAESVGADILLIDVGPSLGALNRAALLACDHVILPVAPDLFSLQGLRNVGPTLREWRQDWQTVRERGLQGKAQERLPPHRFMPLGYVVQQHLARADRPVTGYRRWAELIPSEYREHVLGERDCVPGLTMDQDPHRLAMIPHYASLVPIAQQARKPIFDLKQADGVSGGQLQAVARCRKGFEEIARTLMGRVGLSLH
jgi:chromosome partitioning protein